MHLRWGCVGIPQAACPGGAKRSLLASKPHADRKGVVSTPRSMLCSLRSVCVCHAGNSKEAVDERVLLLEAILPQGLFVLCQDNASVWGTTSRC